MVEEYNDTRSGFLLALTAYTIWGFTPFYIKSVEHIHALHILVYRIVFSLPIITLVLIAMGRTSDLKSALTSWRMVGMAFITAALVTINWGVFIYSVVTDRSLETALGYYINPLFTVMLGAVVLRERLDKLQMTAIALAAVGVAVVTWEVGRLPWMALAVTVSWGLYALARRALPIGPNQGFLLELLILAVPAFAFLVYSHLHVGQFPGPVTMQDYVLLMFGGLVTTVPLLLYANGAKRLKLSTIGIMQYVAPTIIFLIAVFVFREPFSSGRAIAFAIIWSALGIYSISIFRTMRRRPVMIAEETPPLD
ncbi:MAG: EamA family transporter RarD [Rhodobiaceae bacterium]|nr:EamA family transporter RarD [Rhodobiaceae bacterium]MCC0057476.1 EamA family transporter RarD [Rhodobiaceae bacterium]